MTLQSKVVSLGSIAGRSEFGSALEESLHSGSCEYLNDHVKYVEVCLNLKLDSADALPLRLLKNSGPSAISIELTNLAPEGGGSNSLLLAFIRMIDSMLASGRDFDLAHGYLALFLKVGICLSSNFGCFSYFFSFSCMFYCVFLFFSASPPDAVAGLCCHGSFAMPLISFGRRVGGATGVV